LAYDPTKPANGAPILSAELRERFSGLKQLIDDLPASQAMQTLLEDQAAGACKNVTDLNLTVSDPPTQAEVQAFADKLDYLLFNLKRL
jgi:hypothetical protein